jgi:hypothetical protein
MCGYRVTPFAAGCALCGYELDPNRHRSGPGIGRRVSSALAALSTGPRRAPMLPWSPSTPMTYVLLIVTTLFGLALISMVVGLVLWALGLLY